MMRSRILFVTLINDVGSERIVGEVRRQGASCAVLGPPGSFASLVRGVEGRFTVSSPVGGIGMAFVLCRALASATASWRPDRIVPLDELAATLLRAVGTDDDAPAELRNLLVHSFGAPSGYEAACHRVAFVETAARFGVRTPDFWAARWSRAAGPLPFPVMVKRDQSSGSGGVVRVESNAALAAALRSAWVKTVAKAALAYFAGFPFTVHPPLIQKVVDGRLGLYTVACRDGRAIEGVGFEAVEAHPEKKASTVLRLSPNREMAAAARSLVASLGCSGFVSFDFMLDAQDRAFVIEMNPRPIGSTHLGRLFGHDLVHAFLQGERRVHPGAIVSRDTAIALFPKELERDPASPHLGRAGSTLHDMPENEPAVLAAYLAHLEAVHPARHDEIHRHLVPASRSPNRGIPVGGTTELC